MAQSRGILPTIANQDDGIYRSSDVGLKSYAPIYDTPLGRPRSLLNFRGNFLPEFPRRDRVVIAFESHARGLHSFNISPSSDWLVSHLSSQGTMQHREFRGRYSRSSVPRLSGGFITRDRGKDKRYYNAPSLSFNARAAQGWLDLSLTSRCPQSRCKTSWFS